MIRYVIHLIDDEPTIRGSIVASLEEKYRIVAFADAESALDAMAEASPDLVLLDIGLPGMEGV